MLFTARRKTMQPRKRQLLLQFDDAVSELTVLRLASAAMRAISSSTVASPVRFIRFLNLNHPAASTAEFKSLQPAT